MAAIRGGADIKIIAETCNTTAEIGWVVKHDSPVKSIKDLKDRRIGFTNPNSTTHSLALMLLEAAGYKPTDAKTISTGGFGPGLAAVLEHGELDVAPFAEPLFSQAKGKYRLLAWSTDVLPPMVDVLAITTYWAIPQGAPALPAGHAQGLAQGRRLHERQPTRVRPAHRQGLQGGR